MIKEKTFINQKSILLAGKAIEFIPKKTITVLGDKLFDKFLQKYGGFFDVLDELSEPVFLINPLDFPLVFEIKPYGIESYLKIYKKSEKKALKTDAQISGKTLDLIDLLEGKIDGDTLFFNRKLKISGDTQAVVAFRNAIENAQIDFRRDVLSFFEPIKDVVLGTSLAVSSKLYNKIDGLRSFILAPAIEKINELDKKFEDMKNEKDS